MGGGGGDGGGGDGSHGGCVHEFPEILTLIGLVFAGSCKSMCTKCEPRPSYGTKAPPSRVRASTFAPPLVASAAVGTSKPTKASVHEEGT